MVAWHMNIVFSFYYTNLWSLIFSPQTRTPWMNMKKNDREVTLSLRV